MMPKLLLADDSITVQRVIALTFQGEGIEVIAVGDGDLAVAAIDRERPQIVLADLSMPGRDGYAVAEYVKRSPELVKDIRVVLLTGAAEPVEEARSRDLGIDGVLSKPFEPHVATALVRRLLGDPPRVPGSLAVTPDGTACLGSASAAAGRCRAGGHRRLDGRQHHRRRRLLPPARRGAGHRRPVDRAGVGRGSRRHRRPARRARRSRHRRRDDDRLAPAPCRRRRRGERRAQAGRRVLGPARRRGGHGRGVRRRAGGDRRRTRAGAAAGRRVDAWRCRRTGRCRAGRTRAGRGCRRNGRLPGGSGRRRGDRRCRDGRRDRRRRSRSTGRRRHAAAPPAEASTSSRPRPPPS